MHRNCMDHFAYSYSPSRERREAFFANNDDQLNPLEQGHENQKTPDLKPEGTETTIESTRAAFLRNSPDVLSECPEMVSRSPAVLLSFLSGDFMTPDQEARMKSIARKWMEDKFDEDESLATQMIQNLDKNPTDADDIDLQAIIQEALSNPRNVLNLCFAVDERLKQYKRYLAILEKKLGKPLVGDLNITTLDIARIEEIDKELQKGPTKMSFESWLEDNEMNVESAFSGKISADGSPLDQKFALPEVPDGDEELDEAGKAIKRVWANWRKRIENEPDRYMSHISGNATRPTLLNRLKKALRDRFGTVGMQDRETYGYDENATADFNAQETIGKLESQSLALRSHLDALIQQGATALDRQATDLINKEVPPEIRDAHSDEKIYDKFGTSTAALYHEIGEQLSPVARALRQKEDGTENAVPPENEYYLEDANQTLDQLSNLAQSVSDAQKNATEEGWLHSKLVDERADHQSTLNVLKELAEKYDVPENRPVIAGIFNDGERDEIIALAQRVRSGNLLPDDHDRVYAMVDVHARINTILMQLQLHSVRSKLGEELQKPRENVLSSTKLKEWADVSLELDEIEKDLFPEGPNGKMCDYFDHPVCTLSPVRDGLKDEIEEVRRMRLKDRANVYEARDRLRMLQNCYKYAKNLHETPSLVKVLEAEKFKEVAGTDKTVGLYIIGGDGTIYLNASRLPKKPDGTVDKTSEKYIRTLKHEQGHALLDILIRRSGVLTGLLIDIYAELGTKIDANSPGSETFQSLLEKQGERWMVITDKDDPHYHDYLIDELLSKHAGWIESNRTGNYTPEEITLFRGIDTHLVNDSIAKIQSDVREKVQHRAFSTDDEDPISAPSESSDSNSEVDINQKIREFNRTIHMVESFFKEHEDLMELEVTAYKPINGTAGKVSFTKDLQDMKRFVKEKIEETQAAGSIEETTKNITAFESKKDWWDERLSAFRNMDLSKINDAEAKGKNLIDMIHSGDLALLSIMDLVGIGKSIGEDVSRMWKRRGEAAQAHAGEIFTGIVPSWVPYAGRLKHEFKRRGEASELEEVKNWRDPLKNMDSYALMDRLANPSNNSKDETKALLEELSERGRLDLNNEGLWKKLSYLSHYQMPIGPCRDDDVLRDKWLLKLISDIWSDKDNFHNWKRANDSGIKSGKDKFTATADQLSNLSGGLSGELQRQLKLFVENKGSVPEEVNPHLYEEIIHYSIRNGKMSMEEKFYYLIQGVRYGLLSIDRLRVLAGEGGDVLMIFPFIDYFYQKNNDLKTLKKLGERIDEGGFKPKSKTTLFIRLEIAREQAVKERLRKAQSKMGDKIDHDDIPYFLPELGWGAIDDWYRPLGGSRQKLSQEALKNGYVGYNMKFKTYATLMEVEKKGIGNERVSKADIHDLVQTIGAYIYSDNLLTRNGYDGASRPQLTDYEIYNQVPVTGQKGLSVGKYRDAMGGFVKEVLTFIDKDAWKRINKKVGTKEGDEKTKGDTAIDATNFSRKEVGENASDETLSKNIAKSMPYFLEELQNAILKNPESMKKFKEKLYAYGDSFVGDGNIQDAKINKLATDFKTQH
ncbi:MAG: hypothetical protein K9M03_01885 [Kiritimatiellales bacterium]|nr:hypothetical protein [Kiritimatiellales bacterium]